MGSLDNNGDKTTGSENSSEESIIDRDRGSVDGSVAVEKREPVKEPEYGDNGESDDTEEYDLYWGDNGGAGDQNLSGDNGKISGDKGSDERGIAREKREEKGVLIDVERKGLNYKDVDNVRYQDRVRRLREMGIYVEDTIENENVEKKHPNTPENESIDGKKIGNVKFNDNEGMMEELIERIKELKKEQEAHPNTPEDEKVIRLDEVNEKLEENVEKQKIRDDRKENNAFGEIRKNKGKKRKKKLEDYNGLRNTEESRKEIRERANKGIREKDNKEISGRDDDLEEVD